MDKKTKCECNNQWAGSNISWTSKTEVKEKDEREIINGLLHLRKV